MSVFLRYDGTLSVSDAVSVFIMKKKISTGSFHLIQISIKLRGSSGSTSPDGEKPSRNLPYVREHARSGIPKPDLTATNGIPRRSVPPP